MPIVYETAAPAQAMADVNYDLAARRAELASDAGGFGRGGVYGRGGGGGGVIDMGDQNALFARNNESFQREADSLNRTGIPNRDLARARWDTEQQADRFRLQAELQQTELTQAEQMRLSRMKNAIGEVASDPTLAEDEKAAIITRLRTGIDPLEQRLVRSRLAAEAQMKNQHAELFEFQAAARKREADIMAKSAKERMHFEPDPTALSEITEDILSTIAPEARKFLPEGFVERAAQAEALRQGLGTSMYIQPDGKLVPLGESKTKASGTGQQKPTPPFDVSKEWREAWRQAELAQKRSRKEKDSEGKDVTVFENPQDEKWRQNRAEELFDTAFEAYTTKKAQADAEAPVQGGRYNPKAASWRKGQQPPAQAQPNQEVASDATGDKAEAPIGHRMESLKQSQEQVMASGIPPEDKVKASNAMAEAQHIISTYPVRKTRPEAAQKRLDELADSIDAIMKSVKLGQPIPAIAMPPKPAAGGGDKPFTPRGMAQHDRLK